MHPELLVAVNNAVIAIETYESDTFSASHCKVDRVMAERMLAVLIRQFLFEEDGMPGDPIDGAVVGYALDTVIDQD